MTTIFPAIDIYNGKAVRLLGGSYDKVTVYGDPADIAKKFADCGAEWVHVVDLNGAEGSGDNFRIIEKIASGPLKVQSGGGLRGEARVRSLFDAGAERAVLGTVCVSDPELTSRLLDEYGEKIVCGLDVKDGKVAVRGWKEKDARTPLQLGKELKVAGAKYFLFTDISRDGMLTGANVKATAELQRELGVNVIASGGVAGMDDIRAIADAGIYGAIIGKAYYENKIDIEEALEYVRS